METGKLFHNHFAAIVEIDAGGQALCRGCGSGWLISDNETAIASNAVRIVLFITADIRLELLPKFIEYFGIFD